MATRKKAGDGELILETENMQIADAVHGALERRAYKGCEFVLQKRGGTYEIVGHAQGKGAVDYDLICEYVDGYVDAIEDAIEGTMDGGPADEPEPVEVIRGAGAVRERAAPRRRS